MYRESFKELFELAIHPIDKGTLAHDPKFDGIKNARKAVVETMVSIPKDQVHSFCESSKVDIHLLRKYLNVWKNYKYAKSDEQHMEVKHHPSKIHMSHESLLKIDLAELQDLHDRLEKIIQAKENLNGLLKQVDDIKKSVSTL